MQTCPDCHNVIEIAKDNPEYQIIDIGAHVRNLKEFLKLRDTTTAFDAAKRYGAIGLPCFVLEDGTVTLCLTQGRHHTYGGRSVMQHRRKRMLTTCSPTTDVSHGIRQ